MMYFDISPKFPDNFWSHRTTRTGFGDLCNSKKTRQTNKVGTITINYPSTDIEFKQDGIIHHGGIPPDSSTAAVDIDIRLSDHNGG